MPIMDNLKRYHDMGPEQRAGAIHDLKLRIESLRKWVTAWERMAEAEEGTKVCITLSSGQVFPVIQSDDTVTVPNFFAVMAGYVEDGQGLMEKIAHEARILVTRELGFYLNEHDDLMILYADEYEFFHPSK